MTVVAPDRQIVDANGNMTLVMQIWVEEITQLPLIRGVGTPETFVEALEGRLYMDNIGLAGAILYIKRNSDIGGDKKQGWILV